jgi:hypothetical protein
MRANPFTLFIIGHWLSVQSENINGWKLAVQNLSHLGTEETTLSQIKERRQPGLVRLSRWIFKRVCLWRFIRVLAFNLCQFWFGLCWFSESTLELWNGAIFVKNAMTGLG